MPIYPTTDKPVSFDGKTIVVTGASSGIGAATAKVLRSRGARVVGLDIKGDGAGLDSFHHCDLADPESIQSTLGAIEDPLHGLANVAGVPGSFDGETVMRVNFLGLREVTETLLPRLESGSAVVHVASDAGMGWRNRLELIRDLIQNRTYEAGLAWVRNHPFEGSDAYYFSKEAAVVYAIACSMQARPYGVRSLSVSPGAVETPILKNFYETMDASMLDRLKAETDGRNAHPDEIGKVVVFALSQDASWLNGTDLIVDGGAGTNFHFDLLDIDPKDTAKTFFGS